MSAGCLTLGRSLLSKAFMSEQEEAQIQVLEDARVIQGEVAVYEALAASATPFVCSMDEATLHVGAMQGPSNSRGGPAFVRLRASQQQSGFGWRERKAAFDEARRVENRVERMVLDPDPVAAEKRIMQRLAACRLETLNPKAKCGSNSQFEAISVALWATPLYAPLLRQLAVAYMRANPEEYAVFLGDDFEAYLRAVARQGVAGDELTLRAVADHFGVVINLVTADSFMWFLRYAPRQTRSQREVFLAHVAPYVYLPIRRRSPMTMLRLNLAWSSSGDKLARQVQQAQQQQAAQQQQEQQAQQQQEQQAQQQQAAQQQQEQQEQLAEGLPQPSAAAGEQRQQGGEIEEGEDVEQQQRRRPQLSPPTPERAQRSSSTHL